MSKTTSKQRYTQLKEWLSTNVKGSTTKTAATKGKFSKADHYKKQNNRYGSKKSY